MSEFDIRSHEGWLDVDGNPWIVNGLIHEAATLIYARQKVGKSLLTVDLGHALQTREREWLGRKIHGGPYKVAFAVTDPRAERETARRLLALRTPSTPVFRVRRNMRLDSWSSLVDELQGWGVNVLIVDSGTNLVSDINAPQEVGPLMDGLSRLLDEGISVVLVHHISAGGTAAGCYEWRSWPRWHVRAEREGRERLKLTVDGNEPHPDDMPDAVHARLPRPNKPGTRFRLTDREPVAQERTEDRLTGDSELIAKIQEMQPASDGYTSQSHIAETIGVSQAKVSRLLRSEGYELHDGVLVPRLRAA